MGSGLSSFLRVGYSWAEDREEVERWRPFSASQDPELAQEAHEEVERWSALPGRCSSRRGREADEMREVEGCVPILSGEVR